MCATPVSAPKSRGTTIAQATESADTERDVYDYVGNRIFTIVDRTRKLFELCKGDTQADRERMLAIIDRHPEKYLRFPERSEIWHKANQAAHLAMLDHFREHACTEEIIDRSGLRYSLSTIYQDPAGKIKNLVGYLHTANKGLKIGYGILPRYLIILHNTESGTRVALPVLPWDTFYMCWDMSIANTAKKTIDLLLSAGKFPGTVETSKIIAMSKSPKGFLQFPIDVFNKIIEQNRVPLVCSYIHGLPMRDPIRIRKEDIPNASQFIEQLYPYESQYQGAMLRLIGYDNPSLMDMVQAPRRLREECLNLMRSIPETTISGALHVYFMPRDMWETLKRESKLSFVIFAAAKENPKGVPGGPNLAVMLVSPNVQRDIFEMTKDIQKIKDWTGVDINKIIGPVKESIPTQYYLITGFFPSADHYRAFCQLGKQVSEGNGDKTALFNYVHSLQRAKWKPEETDLHREFMQKFNGWHEELKDTDMAKIHIGPDGEETALAKDLFATRDEMYAYMTVYQLGAELQLNASNRDARTHISNLLNYAENLKTAGLKPEETALHKEFMSMVEACTQERLEKSYDVSVK